MIYRDEAKLTAAARKDVENSEAEFLCIHLLVNNEVNLRVWVSHSREMRVARVTRQLFLPVVVAEH